ncbi:unnamed protein product, partial [Cladocopium goreaui]
EEADKVAQRLAPEGVDQLSPEVPVQTKSMCLQSFTMTEVFYRCSVDFPQVEIHSGGSKKDKTALRLCFGQAFNLDEAYEFLENLSLLGSRSDKGKDSSANAHTSTLNTLLARGKTKRAMRTPTSYEASRTQHISLSLLGNGHPSKLISMERNLEGQHAAATKECFLLCVDVSVPRHETLYPDMLAADGSWPAWAGCLCHCSMTWQMASSRSNRTRPSRCPEGLQVLRQAAAQRPGFDRSSAEALARQPSGAFIRATGKDGQSSMGALHANAAHQQGILSAAVAILEMAAGSGSFDEQGQLQVTEDHVQAAVAVTSLLELAAPCESPLPCHTGLGRPALLANQWTKGQLVGQFKCHSSVTIAMLCCLFFFAQVAARMVELSLEIREVLRGPVDAAIAPTSDSEGEQFKPVQVPAPQKRFAPPVATQEQDASQPTKGERLEDEDHVPVSVPECCSQHVQQQGPAKTEPQNPLHFLDLEPADAFFSRGLGENGVMILPGDMQDRSLMRKLLLLGRSELTLAKAVDIYHVTEIKNGKRRKLRPPQAKVLQVFQTVFSLYPRFGQVNLSTRRGSEMLYHNEAMRCCRVSIREISKRRALWHDRDAGRDDLGDDAPQGVEGEEPEAEEVAVVTPQPATPPCGRR